MKLTELNIYPVKSLKGIALQSATVETRGLQYDRRWMLVDHDRQFFTQREVPAMARVKIEVGPDGLTASMNGNRISVVPEMETGEMDDVTVWGSTVKGAFYGQDIDDWFSDALETKCRLVSMPESTKRMLPAEFAVRVEEDHVSFADGYPFLLIGQSSLDDLNTRLEDQVPMNRFRPNFVVEGSSPFEEDEWKRIRIGSTEFHLVKPCARCVMTTVDQDAGVKTGKEPLKTLSEYRNFDGKVLFGQNLIAESVGGVVRVGDEVTVLE
ncbi:MAG TPA: MOSC domain-containing protein [Pyrinomonadaceae bacterium]|nr:MOSC domain-containing protein [Pyrinomonadaceae bacterium]